METIQAFKIPGIRHDEVLHFQEILYLEGQANYTLFHLKNGSKRMSCRNLLFHEKFNLDKTFLRIHKTYCINSFYIKSYCFRIEPEIVELFGGAKLSVSRRRCKILKNMYKNILE